MADILTLVFRTFVSQTEVRKKLTVSPAPCSSLLVGDPSPPPCSSLLVGDPSPPPCSSLLVGDPSPPPCSTLLVGDPGLGRSVLLLAAVTAASEMGVRVVFFSQTQIQSLPASLQKVSTLSPDSLKRIQFSYPRTVEELLHQVASLHESCNTSPTPPSLVIVDGLEGFLRGCGGGGHSASHPGRPSSAAHLAALLSDSAVFLTQLLKQRCSSSAPCRVIASFAPEADAVQAGAEASATDPVLDVLDRYFQVRCTLDRDRTYEAAAAGLQEVWHVYLSGTGLTETAALSEDCEDRAAVAQEWQLVISPDGSMEFKLV